MRARVPIAAAAALLAVAGLSACKSNAGSAAVIDGHRISESTVHSYLIPAGASADVISQAAQSGQSVNPKSIVMNTLVQVQVFELTLTAMPGGLPSDSDLNAAHDEALITLATQGQESSDQFASDLRSGLTTHGIQQSLFAPYMHALDLEYALILRTKATAPADLAKAINAAHVSVSVNPAYGYWDATNFQITPASNEPNSSSAPSNLPDFLTLPSSVPSVAPSTPGG